MKSGRDLHRKMGWRRLRTGAGKEKGAALIPSSKKRRGTGTTRYIRLATRDAAFVRTMFDGMEGADKRCTGANETW